MGSSNNNQGMTIFVLGLLSIVFCQLLGPVAWTMGNNYVRDCIMDGRDPDGMGVAGRIMGMIGTGILVLNVVLIGGYICCIGGLIASGDL